MARPRDALAAVQDFDPRHASPYGVMAWESDLACAYAQLDDRANLEATMSYMKAHAQDAPKLLEQALLCAGDEDAVAKTIIAHLADPETRGATLAEMQDYLRLPTEPAWGARMIDRRMTIRSRPDVEAAIAKVGRIGAYPLTNW